MCHAETVSTATLVATVFEKKPGLKCCSSRRASESSDDRRKQQSICWRGKTTTCSRSRSSCCRLYMHVVAFFSVAHRAHPSPPPAAPVGRLYVLPPTSQAFLVNKLLSQAGTFFHAFTTRFFGAKEKNTHAPMRMRWRGSFLSCPAGELMMMSGQKFTCTHACLFKSKKARFSGQVLTKP